MRVFAVFSHQSLSLAPSLLQAWGRCTKAAALSAYALHKRGFCHGLGTRDLPESTSPPQSRPERQTALPIEKEKVGGGDYQQKAPREPRLFLSVSHQVSVQQNGCFNRRQTLRQIVQIVTFTRESQTTFSSAECAELGIQMSNNYFKQKKVGFENGCLIVDTKYRERVFLLLL